jgi:hypothetical protein
MSDQIIKDHRETIGASGTVTIMTYLQSDNLPKGAMSLVEAMCRGSDDELSQQYESPAMAWGKEQEQHAIAAIAEELGCEIEFAGDDQKRLYAGYEYANFISALADAHGKFSDGSIITIEAKCLNTDKHDYIIQAVGDDIEALKREDFAKYCQVQTQNICAEVYYEKPVSSIIVFYDPRSTIKQLHYLIVVDADDQSTIDHEFRAKLKQRAMLAKQLYDSIKAEPDRAPVIFDGELPETKLVKTASFEVTAELLQQGVEEIARKVAESVGVEIVDLSIENDKVTKYTLKGGEVFNCEVKEGREQSEALEKKIKKVISLVKKANAPLRESALAEHRKYTATDRLIESLIMPIVNHVGSKRAEWLAEQKRIQDEAIAAEAEKQRLADEQAEKVRQAILVKMQVFTALPVDNITHEAIEAKREEIKGVVIDAMFGEFEQQAIEAKEHALEYLLNAEAKLVSAEEQARLDRFNEFKAKCEALSDPMHSAEYLESQLIRLATFAVPSDEHEFFVYELIGATQKALHNVLIPAAKKRAIDLAEKLKAEEAKVPSFVEQVAKYTHDALESSRLSTAVEENHVVDPTEMVKPQQTAEIVPINTGVIAESEFVEVKKQDTVISKMETTKPVIHESLLETTEHNPYYDLFAILECEYGLPMLDDQLNGIAEAAKQIIKIDNEIITRCEYEQLLRKATHNDNIIAMYAAMNPELHKQVVELAGQIDDFIQSEQQSSFLTRLFNLRTKSGQELKQAFITVAKSLRAAA